MALVGDLKRFAKKRSKEFQQLGSADLTADLAEANVAGQKVTFKLNVERTAAWKLYVELNTRIATQPLDESDGVLREALSSLYAVFGITRETLKEAGPAVSMNLLGSTRWKYLIKCCVPCSLSGILHSATGNNSGNQRCRPSRMSEIGRELRH